MGLLWSVALTPVQIKKELGVEEYWCARKSIHSPETVARYGSSSSSAGSHGSSDLYSQFRSGLFENHSEVSRCMIPVLIDRTSINTLKLVMRSSGCKCWSRMWPKCGASRTRPRLQPSLGPSLFSFSPGSSCPGPKDNGLSSMVSEVLGLIASPDDQSLSPSTIRIARKRPERRSPEFEEDTSRSKRCMRSTEESK